MINKELIKDDRQFLKIQLLFWANSVKQLSNKFVQITYFETK